MSEPYKNPPVVEAVFEIRFPAELSIECHRDQYYDKIRKDFPKIFVPKTGNVLDNYRFEAEDGTSLIQFSINKFSYHSKKYTRFEEFSKKTEEYTKLFCEMHKISRLKRTGLRYLDHIPINLVNDKISIEKYLNFGYKLPDYISPQVELFQTILLTKLGDGKIRIMVQTNETAQKEIIIALDFDFFLEGELLTENLKEYLNKSHEHTKRVFEDFISDEYKKKMKGES